MALLAEYDSAVLDVQTAAWLTDALATQVEQTFGTHGRGCLHIGDGGGIGVAQGDDEAVGVGAGSSSEGKAPFRLP